MTKTTMTEIERKALTVQMMTSEYLQQLLAWQKANTRNSHETTWPELGSQIHVAEILEQAIEFIGGHKFGDEPTYPVKTRTGRTVRVTVPPSNNE